MLDGLPAPLLGNLLSHSLLVHTTVDNSPGDLSGVLPLEEEGLGLRVDEPEDLSRVAGIMAVISFVCTIKSKPPAQGKRKDPKILARPFQSRDRPYSSRSRLDGCSPTRQLTLESPLT